MPSSYTCAVVEEALKMHAVVRHVGIALSADFRPGPNISIFYDEELHVRQQLWGRDELWVITVSNIIGIMGAVRLWEAADPKDKKKCVAELPCFTLQDGSG